MLDQFLKVALLGPIFSQRGECPLDLSWMQAACGLCLDPIRCTRHRKQLTRESLRSERSADGSKPRCARRLRGFRQLFTRARERAALTARKALHALARNLVEQRIDFFSDELLCVHVAVTLGVRFALMERALH